MTSQFGSWQPDVSHPVRHFRPALESLEDRTAPVTILPGLTALTGQTIRYKVVGGTAQDAAVIGIVARDLLSGMSLRLVAVGPRQRADWTVVLGVSPSISTGGYVRHTARTYGTAYTTLPAGLGADPLRWADAIGHELGHGLGIAHNGWGPASPPIGVEEWQRLYAFGASIGWTVTTSQFQWGPKPGTVDLPMGAYDPTSLWEANPFRAQRAFAGAGLHLSGADRAALRGLFG